MRYKIMTIYTPHDAARQLASIMMGIYGRRQQRALGLWPIRGISSTMP